MNEAQSRLLNLVTELEEPEVLDACEAYVDHLQRPGPIIALAGSRQRGKSTFFRAVTGLSSEAVVSSGPAVAYDENWALELHKHPSLRFAKRFPQCDSLGGCLLIDSPALDEANSRSMAEAVTQMADLRLLLVQASQPAGQIEHDFAEAHLGDGRAVLILTKCDQLEVEELEDAISGAHNVYDNVPWMATLLHQRDGQVEDCGWAPALPWWHSQAQQIAHLAWEQRHAALSRQFETRLEATVSGRRATLQSELASVGEALASSEHAAFLIQGRRSIRDALEQAEQRAMRHYTEQLPHLHDSLVSISDTEIAELSKVDNPSSQELISRLETAIKAWDTETREKARSEAAGCLNLARSTFAELEARCAAGAVENQGYSGNHEPSANFPEMLRVTGAALDSKAEISTSELLRNNITPVVGGGGALMLGANLLGFLGPIGLVAAAGIGILSFIGIKGSGKEAARRRIESDMHREVNRLLSRLNLDLRDSYRSEWRRWREQIEAQVNALLGSARNGVPPSGTPARPQLEARRKELEQLEQRLQALNALEAQIRNAAGRVRNTPVFMSGSSSQVSATPEEPSKPTEPENRTWVDAI